MYNRIHNDYDTNVVRVELNSTYHPQKPSRIKLNSREQPSKITSSTTINRNDTFTKHDQRPTSNGIVRSETFIVKTHQNYDESTDERPTNGGGDYSTYTKSKKKHNSSDRNKYDHGDKSYDTYIRRGSRSEKRGSIVDDEKSLYINTDTYRKLDKKRASLLSQESENLNANTFTKSSKPKRVESFIRKIEKNLWKRRDSKKEPSPAPSSHSSDQSSTIKRSKNIFNLISGGGRKSTREVEVQCKMDEEKDYYSGIAMRKSSISDAERKHSVSSSRPLKQRNYENGSNQKLTGIMKSSQPDYRNLREYESTKKSLTPAPIRIEIDLRNTNKRPIGVASPLQQKTRSALKNGVKNNYDKKSMENTRSHAPPSSVRLQIPNDHNNIKRDGNERVSFREYREQLRAAKNENRHKITDNSDDDLRRSYQQSFFVPM